MEQEGRGEEECFSSEIPSPRSSLHSFLMGRGRSHRVLRQVPPITPCRPRRKARGWGSRTNVPLIQIAKSAPLTATRSSYDADFCSHLWLHWYLHKSENAPMSAGFLPLLPTPEGGEGRGEEAVLLSFPSLRLSPHSFLAGREGTGVDTNGLCLWVRC